jgi:hypothetical protein
MSAAVRWPPIVLASSLLLVGVVAADVDGPARVALSLWFLGVCTGMAFVPLLPVESPAARVALAVALSVAIDTFVVTVLLVTGAFSMTNGLLALVPICIAGCALQARRSSRGRLAGDLRLY